MPTPTPTHAPKINANERLIVALDVPGTKEARGMVVA